MSAVIGNMASRCSDDAAKQDVRMIQPPSSPRANSNIINELTIVTALPDAGAS